MAMKNTNKFFGIIAVLAAFGLFFTACQNPETEQVDNRDHDQLAAEYVMGLINSIGQPITLASEAAIDAARRAFNELTPIQRGRVTNLAILENAEAQLRTLQMQEEVRQINALINALANITVISDLAAAIATIDTRISAWTGNDLVGINTAELERQRQRVPAHLAMEAEVAEINRLIDELAGISDTNELGAAIGRIDERIAAWTGDTLVGINTAELNRQRERYNSDQAAARIVIDLINAIGTVTLGSTTAIQNARTAFNNLTPLQQGLVTNLNVLENAEIAYATLHMEAEVNAINALIADLANFTTYAQRQAGLTAIGAINARISGWNGIPLVGVNDSLLASETARINAIENFVECKEGGCPGNIASGTCTNSKCLSLPLALPNGMTSPFATRRAYLEWLKETFPLLPNFMPGTGSSASGRANQVHPPWGTASGGTLPNLTWGDNTILRIHLTMVNAASQVVDPTGANRVFCGPPVFDTNLERDREPIPGVNRNVQRLMTGGLSAPNNGGQVNNASHGGMLTGSPSILMILFPHFGSHLYSINIPISGHEWSLPEHNLLNTEELRRQAHKVPFFHPNYIDRTMEFDLQTVIHMFDPVPQTISDTNGVEWEINNHNRWDHKANFVTSNQFTNHPSRIDPIGPGFGQWATRRTFGLEFNADGNHLNLGNANGYWGGPTLPPQRPNNGNGGQGLKVSVPSGFNIKCLKNIPGLEIQLGE